MCTKCQGRTAKPYTKACVEPKRLVFVTSSTRSIALLLLQEHTHPQLCGQLNLLGALSSSLQNLRTNKYLVSTEMGENSIISHYMSAGALIDFEASPHCLQETMVMIK